ncbi:D-alanine--D-alanine ligase family protein [Fimbriiglobus ruber]|uniref:D-alanine--D-alanine ligase n=1 Tax=Fimbriiglobus ruber TaxID=1908690 RepID=A0A225EFI1_9BACT|nr:ATP-grasp domain-containing protein [Fimbriiglobus ruber]OWK46997.1 D-alanine-D-alanine ligase and related ATP-grasp enzymes-like [Fimbriiglobus ruber]
MKIGIAFDLKPDGPLPPGAPDDWHEEFDAPVTIRAIGDVLRGLGHDVRELGNGRPLLEALLRDPPDFVFNFAEGTGTSRSREARVPAVCEMLGIPYTGSDPLALAVALEKDLTRRLALDAGVMVPAGLTLSPPRAAYDGDFAEFPPLLAEAGLTLPVIAKPVFEGSSKGVRNRCLIEKPEDFGPTVAFLWNNYHQTVLVEEFIAGDEVTVGIVGNDPPRVLGVMRIVPKTATDRFVYSLEVKRDYQNHVEYECPARLPADILREVEAAALTVYDALGCRDVARLDFRIRDGLPYFIETNPLPGLNPETSDLVILARLMNVSHAELVGMIFAAAAERYGIK